MRSKAGEGVNAMSFGVEASELDCVSLMKSRESRKGCKAAVVQKDKRGQKIRPWNGCMFLLHS